MANGFLSILKPLDAQRLQKSVKATVQNSGRLTFAMDAVKDMQLDETKSIIILAAEDGSGDLGAVISEKDDPEAFTLKRCGAYFYVSFKNYLQQNGIDYKRQRISYDITELDENYKGKPLYKFERQIHKKDGSGDAAVQGTSDASASTCTREAVSTIQDAELAVQPAMQSTGPAATNDISTLSF